MVVKEVVMVEVKVVVLASEHCDCVIHSCNNNFIPADSICSYSISFVSC